MLHTATYLPPCTSITSVRNNYPNAAVYYVESSFLIFVVYRLPYAHALPLIYPFSLSFSKINNIRASLFCSQVCEPYAKGSMESLLYSWVFYFMTAAAPFWGDFFIPFFSDHCVIIKCDIMCCNSSPWVTICLRFLPLVLRRAPCDTSVFLLAACAGDITFGASARSSVAVGDYFSQYGANW